MVSDEWRHAGIKIGKQYMLHASYGILYWRGNFARNKSIAKGRGISQQPRSRNQNNYSNQSPAYRVPAAMVLQAIRYQPATSSSAPSLEILDQLALPHRSTYFHIYNCEDAHEAIRQMRVRGAPAIAIVAALALAVEISGARSRGKLANGADSVRGLVGERLEYLKTSRPTAVNLADAVRKLKAIVKAEALEQDATGESVAEKYILAAEVMLVHDVQDNEAIGRHGANWIQEHTTAGRRRAQEKSGELKILTHCNTG
jgi:methylthioribose-1-phosphate isomerase